SQCFAAGTMDVTMIIAREVAAARLAGKLKILRRIGVFNMPPPTPNKPGRMPDITPRMLVPGNELNWATKRFDSLLCFILHAIKRMKPAKRNSKGLTGNTEVR